MGAVVGVVVVVVAALLLVVVLRGRGGGRHHPARGITVGMSRAEVVRRLGNPPGGVSTGRDVLYGGASVVGGIGSPGEALLSEEYWLYQNVPPGNHTQIVMSGRGYVTGVEIVPA